MNGPAGVMALVLAETAAGATGFLFLTPLWREVRPGFFYLTGAVVVVLAGAAAGAAALADDAVGAPGDGLAISLATALAAATLLWILLMAVRARSPARLVGVLTVPLAGTMLAAFARTAPGSVAAPFFQLLAGAVFTGAVMDGLLLGHWYLTDRKLTRGPITRMAWALIAAVGLEAAGVIVGLGGAEGTRASAGSLNPLLTMAGSASWIALGMVVITGLIAGAIRLTLRGARPTAVQSATGFFYLAVITGFTAELAAKVRFLP